MSIPLHPLTSEVRVNKLHAVVSSHPDDVIILGEDKTTVMLDDQVRVYLAEEAYEVGKRR